MNLVEFCRQLTAIDSSISHGTCELAEFVARQAQGWGFAVDLQYENLNGIPNANVILRPEGTLADNNLLLVSRMDTLDPGDYGYWVRTGANPFNASIDGENMYGLGLVDAKADLACKLLALRSVRLKKFKKKAPVLLGTFGLGSGIGAIRFIRKKAISVSAAIVGAPTQLRLARKGPGYAKVEISIPFSVDEIKNRERHDLSEASVSESKMFSRKSDGSLIQGFIDNPILRVIEYLKNLPEGMSIISIEGGVNSDAEPDSAVLEVDLSRSVTEGVGLKLIAIGEALKRLSAELKTVIDTDLSPAYSTVTVGTIRTLPEEIRISGVCRLVPAEGRNVYESWIEGLRQACANTGAMFHIIDYKPPFVAVSDEAFFKFAKSVLSDVGLNEDLIAAKRCTEANVFQRLGIESAIFGPGGYNNPAHASQEYVQVKDLERATEFYTKLIERYCQ